MQLKKRQFIALQMMINSPFITIIIIIVVIMIITIIIHIQDI